MKTLGLSLIVACSIGLGTFLHNREQMKLKKLELLIALFDEMKTYMKCTLFSTKDIFLRLAENREYEALSFVHECSESLKKGIEFPIAYRSAVKNHDANFSEECKRMLVSLGNRLGTTDLQGQLSYVELTLEKLRHECDEMRSQYRKKENMYLPLSVLAGIGIAIVMY